jgi:hypothetical protein
MVTIIDSFGVTTEELEAVKSEAERLAKMGYKVPAEIEIKIMSTNGLAGTMKRMYIHPNTNIEMLKFVVRHEIGHHNEPEVEFDIWSDDCLGGYLTNSKIHQKSEDFANAFANKTG